MVKYSFNLIIIFFSTLKLGVYGYLFITVYFSDCVRSLKTVKLVSKMGDGKTTESDTNEIGNWHSIYVATAPFFSMRGISY